MRTLAYCTAFSATLNGWARRYRPWLNAVQRLGIADQILMVDDGSPVLPGWDGLHFSSGDHVQSALAPLGRGAPILHHFANRLGRSDVFDCPGWYRSYGFGVAYAMEHGFDRVLHIESDAFIISDRLKAYAGAFSEGWVALWTERYQFPELAIQLAAGKGLRAFHDFTRQPYDCLAGQVHEYVVPFTHVERCFNGDRHGETNGPVPRGIDYVCQIQPQREAPYYWWLPRGAKFGPNALREDQALTYNFGTGGNSDEIVGHGWSQPEADMRWMTNYFSIVRLPVLTHGGDFVLRLNVHPLVHGGEIPSQLLRVTLNGRPITDLQVDGDLIVGTVLPAAQLRRDGTDVVGFIHPDANAPTLLNADLLDPRILSVALRHIALIPLAAA